MNTLQNFKPNLIPNNPKGKELDLHTPIMKNGGYSMYKAIKKKDGCRLQLFSENVLSRSLKEPGSLLVVKRFKKIAQRLHELGIAADGEFYMHGQKFNSIFRFFSKSDVTCPKYRIELEKALKKDPKKFAIDYDGLSIDFLTQFHDDLKFHLFDGILIDAPGLTRFQDRMIEIEHRLKESGFDKHIHIQMPTLHTVNSKEELQELYEEALEEGYEGLVLVHVGHEYKFGRNSLNQGTLLKQKDDAIEYDGIVVDVVEGTMIREGVESTTNELGRSVTSKKKDDRESSGMAKGLITAFYKEDGTYIGTFTVGLKGFDNDQKKELLKNKASYIGQHFVYTAMNAVKDMPRHAYFKNWRDAK